MWRVSRTLAADLFELRTREFSANDITLWVARVLQELFGITSMRMRTEVFIRGKTPGRADLVVEDSVGFETKKDLRREQVDAEAQVGRLLERFEAEGEAVPVVAATDGVGWQFYILADGVPHIFYEFDLKADTPDDTLRELLWVGLTSFRTTTGRPPPTAEGIARAFHPDSPSFREVRVLFRSTIEQLLRQDAASVTSKFLPWFDLFSYVYNDFRERCKNIPNPGRDLVELAAAIRGHAKAKNESPATIEGALELFFRHTYLAIIAKTLSALVTLGEEGVVESVARAPSGILSGQALIDSGLRVCETNDFFSWPAGTGLARKIVSSVLRPLQRFSDEYTDDVFRHLYEGVVDASTRHELGEFFTPKWIAQLLASDMIDASQQSVLDPACGSGTFLVVALRRKAELYSKTTGPVTRDVVRGFLDQVWGIDVNPVSVILSRTNLYLATTQILRGKPQLTEISPRVYVSDTFVLPRFVEAQRQVGEAGQPSSVVPAPVTPDVTVPILPGLSPDQAIELIEHVGGLVEQGRSPDEVAAEIEGNPDYTRALARTMLSLRSSYGDSLWRYVLRNYGIPPLLVAKFDVVFGNPPWLTYREARENVQSIMGEVAEQFHVGPSAKAKTSFNLAVAFFLTSQAFAKPGGVIGFVFPLSVISSPSHVPFIELLLSGDDFELVAIYDLGGVEPPPFPHRLPSALLAARVKGVKD